MTKEDIVIETVKYYYTHNRAFAKDTDKCTYLNDEGEGCAIGRIMLKKYREKYKNDTNIAVSGLLEEYGSLDKLIAKKYHGHPRSFWRELQMLHDMDHNWIGHKLSEIGLKNVEVEFGKDCVNKIQDWYSTL